MLSTLAVGTAECNLSAGHRDANPRSRILAIYVAEVALRTSQRASFRGTPFSWPERVALADRRTTALMSIQRVEVLDRRALLRPRKFFAIHGRLRLQQDGMQLCRHSQDCLRSGPPERIGQRIVDVPSLLLSLLGRKITGTDPSLLVNLWRPSWPRSRRSKKLALHCLLPDAEANERLVRIEPSLPKNRSMVFQNGLAGPAAVAPDDTTPRDPTRAERKWRRSSASAN